VLLRLSLSILLSGEALKNVARWIERQDLRETQPPLNNKKEANSVPNERSSQKRPLLTNEPDAQAMYGDCGRRGHSSEIGHIARLDGLAFVSSKRLSIEFGLLGVRAIHGVKITTIRRRLAQTSILSQSLFPWVKVL
jgi:hypothetical protein